MTSPHAELWPHLRRALLIAAVAVAAIFLAYELVERLLLAELDPQRLGVLHRVRGLMASLLAAALVALLLLRNAPALPERWPAAPGFGQFQRPTRQQRRRAYAQWFIRMRWLALLASALLVLPVVWALQLVRPDALVPLLLTLLVLAGLNGLYTAMLRRQAVPAALLPVQAYGDLLVLTVLLHFSGGIDNPLAPLMLIHVIIAGVVLSPRHCFAVAAVGSVLFAAMALGQASGLLAHYPLLIAGRATAVETAPLYVASHILVHAAILLLTAYFVSALGRRIRRDEQQLVRLADEALAHRQLVEQALQTTETGLCVCDGQARSTWTNERWRAWFGDAGVDELATACGCASPARQAMDVGQRCTAEITLPPDADPRQQRTYQITTAPLAGRDGKPTHVVSLARDITDQLAMQARMLRAGKLAAVGELAGQVAHEVNNPIAIISAKARLLLENDREPVPAKLRSELVKITDLADRVAQIAQGLLSYCRPSPATRQPTNLATPIRAALATVDHRARGQGVSLDDQLPDELPPVNANAGEIQQVFLNLLLNALDAMPDGGRLTLTADIDDGDESLTITVADTGHGIDPSILDQVLEPFYTTKADGKGTGLGLSICDGLVRSHGGELRLDSTPGAGTRVHVALPIAERQHDADHLTREARA